MDGLLRIGLSVAGLLAIAVGGCYPHVTRPLRSGEARAVDGMCARIRSLADQVGNPDIRAVSEAIDRAHGDGDILVYEDELTDRRERGAVNSGRLYLHKRLFSDEDPVVSRHNLFALQILYHEGVHLTQSYCTLVLSPDRAEEEAREKTSVFTNTLKMYRRRVFRDDE